MSNIRFTSFEQNVVYTRHILPEVIHLWHQHVDTLLGLSVLYLAGVLVILPEVSYIVMILSDCRRGFGLDIAVINHFNTTRNSTWL
jgi:hypothetical protein